MSADMARTAIALSMAATVLAATPDAGRRREYFQLLRPGITLAEIAAEIGDPDSTTEGTAVYRLPGGQVELAEEEGRLTRADLKGVGGDVSHSLYHAGAEALRPPPAQLDERERWIARGEFRRLDQWGGGFLRTERHRGLVFLLRNGYVVIEETSPMAGRDGAFANLISKATVYGQGETRVVWRLFESWAKVRPPYLTTEELVRREEVLVRDGHLPGDKLAKKLGEPDGTMGSGRRFDQYYLRDGLLIVFPVERGAKHLEQPGLDEPLTLAEWLTARRAAAPGR